MEHKMKSNNTALPFLARFATERTEGENIPGWYSYEQDLWVVQEDSKETPIISKYALTQTVTKTKVRQESDDDSSVSMLELTTKTGVQLERDDSDLSMNHLLELMTKTDTIQERDDDNWNTGNILELSIKTFVSVERDEDFSMHTYDHQREGLI